MNMTEQKDYYSNGNFKRVALMDLCVIDNCTGYVTNLGRKYVEILFYPNQAKRGRIKIDPTLRAIYWTGTKHI